jgi:hypothetical protein
MTRRIGALARRAAEAGGGPTTRRLRTRCRDLCLDQASRGEKRGERIVRFLDMLAW